MRRTLALLVLAGGCKSPPPTSAPASEAEAVDVPAPVEAEPTVAEDLERMEAALLESDFQLRFAVEATGAVTAKLAGDLRCHGPRLQLRATGSFGADVVDASLTADGERLTGSSGAARLDVAQPPELRDAVVVGLTRMGILHNLAVLIAGRPPDHAEGGVREWVRVTDVVAEARIAPDALGDDARAQATDAMSFRIEVAGNEAGEATLWWNRDTGLPVERHQIVRFPGGEMHVRETYTAEAIE